MMMQDEKSSRRLKRNCTSFHLIEISLHHKCHPHRGSQRDSSSGNHKRPAIHPGDVEMIPALKMVALSGRRANEILTRVLFCVWDSLVATKYCTGANTAMTVAPIKALIPKR